jgi:hypothetical protein
MVYKAKKLTLCGIVLLNKLLSICNIQLREEFAHHPTIQKFARFNP